MIIDPKLSAGILVSVTLRKFFNEFGDCDEIRWDAQRIHVLYAGRGFVLEFQFNDDSMSPGLRALASVPGYEGNCEIAKSLMIEVQKMFMTGGAT